MSFTKKNLVLFSFILFAFTACNLNFLAHKSGQLFFDFSSFAPEKNSNSRSAIEDYVEDGKDYYIDLTIDGSYKFSATIDLKDVNTYTIDNIPVGTRIKAKIDFYTYNIPGDLYSRETLLNGESKYYTITAGVNEIVINLKSEFVKLYVRYNQDYQNNDFENEDPDNNGKTPSTGFYYIQSAINWIAENGKNNRDYKILLIGYDAEHPFKQKISFGEDYNDYFRYKANSVILTSENKNICAWTPTSNTDNIYVCTNTPVILENIKIVSNGNNILETPDTNAQNITCNVFLGNGTVFYNSAETSSSAISIENGSVTMTGNAEISNFKNHAVTVGAGSFKMKDNSKIKDCYASNNGGAILLEGMHASFTLNDNATIDNCSADNGGAIYHKGSSVTINSGNIINCKAKYGGAIYVDTSSHDLSLTIKGGIIKDNEVTSTNGKGSGIYLGEIDGDNTYLNFVLSDNACIDLSNDIYFAKKANITNSHQKIKLVNTLPGEKVARLTYANNLSDAITLFELADYYLFPDADAIKNNATKFYISDSDDSTHHYLTQDGKANQFSSFLTAPTSPEDTENQIQLGDIVFADNSRIRATDFDKIDYKLYSSIAGIVFYVGSDDGFLGNTNLIVGTKYYTGNFEKQAYSSTSVFPHFDKTNIKSFPNYASNYDNGDTSPDKSTKSISEINEEDYLNIEKESINSGITSDLLSRIKNGYFPLYSKVINYGKEEKFESTRYSYDETSNVANNWYVPRIEEYIVFAQALEDPYIKNLYIKISGDNLKGDYISESIMWSKYTIPAHCAYGMLNKTYYPYNFGINFETDSIIQLVTPPFNYEEHKAFPIHIYTPGD